MSSKSPFPGVDPFIEPVGLWQDFHSHLIEEIAHTLADMMPERYVARTGKRSYPSLAETQTFVEICSIDEPSQLVAAIEVLSPSNKRKGTPGWDEYLRKRQALLLGAAHFIEIDLLRGGQRMRMVDPWPESPYYLLVSRQSVAPVCKVWPAYSLSPLPTIPVPLLPPDADLLLSLQPLHDAIYARYRYERSIDYHNAAGARLAPQETQALKERLG